MGKITVNWGSKPERLRVISEKEENSPREEENASICTGSITSGRSGAGWRRKSGNTAEQEAQRTCYSEIQTAEDRYKELD